MLYKNAFEQLQEVSKEIDQIKMSLQKAYSHRGQKDFEACLWMLRNTLEGICKNVFMNEISRDINGLELRHIIKKLEEENKIPRHIMPHIRTVQTFGNLGSHSVPMGNNEFDDKMILPAITSMEIIYTWFVKTYQGYTDDQSLKTILSLNRFYEEDKNGNTDYAKTDQYISSETIMIVIGPNIGCEIFDRKPAELLRKEIDDAGSYDKRRRAIIVTDAWLSRDFGLHNKHLISFGNKWINTTTDSILSNKNGSEIVSLSTRECRVISTSDDILFVFDAPWGTMEAVQKFIDAEEGLKKFLRVAWKL